MDLDEFRDSTPHLPRLNSGHRMDTPESGLTQKASSSISRSNYNSLSRSRHGRNDRPELGPRRVTLETDRMRENRNYSTHSAKKSCATGRTSTAKESSSLLSPKFSQMTGKTLPRDISSSRSARFSDRLENVLSQDSPSQIGKYSSIRSPKSDSDESFTMSPFKFSLCNKSEIGSNHSSNAKKAWETPTLPHEQYEEIKERLLKQGKFQTAMRAYFKVDTATHLNKNTDESDDGYDTDLESGLGFDLIADEKTKSIKEDGVFPEYKQDCRKFKSVPNTYFMRHGLDDEMAMRYRYLSPGDSRCLSSQIQNHLTMSKIDFSNNSIGDMGMVTFKNMLKQNKTLVDLNLSNNCIGPKGAKLIRNAMQSNYFLLRLNVAGNEFGERGGRYCASIIEDNVKLQELVLAGNHIGETGAVHMAKALAKNSVLRLLDISWNHIGRIGGEKLAESLKKNTSLETFLASTNGFGNEGGLALVNSLRGNKTLREVDLANNRTTDKFLKELTSSINTVKSLFVIQLGQNNFSPKAGFDLMASLMASNCSLKYVGLDVLGIEVTDEIKGIANALKIVQDVTIAYDMPPSKREITTDILTRNLTVICDFLENEELEIEDIFPDYDDYYDYSDVNDGNVNDGKKYGRNGMLTTADVLSAIEVSGKVSRNKIERLRSMVRYGKGRRFLVSELSLVYDKVICGKDPMVDQPLRTHLRRSIKEEKLEKERIAREKKKSKY